MQKTVVSVWCGGISSSYFFGFALTGALTPVVVPFGDAGDFVVPGLVFVASFFGSSPFVLAFSVVFDFPQPIADDSKFFFTKF